MTKTYHGTIELPSKPLTVDLKAPSEYFDGQTKQFLMSDDNGSRLIPVTFDGKKATIPAVKGTGKLMIYFVY
jgi:hypothetical protein